MHFTLMVINMIRRKSSPEKLVVITFKIPKSLLERVERYRLKTGESRSHIIRQAIEEFLSKRESGSVKK